MASDAQIYEDRHMSIGSVFQRALATVAHNPVVVLILAVLLGALPSVVFSYFNGSVMRSQVESGGSLRGVYGAMALSWIVSVVISAVVQAALTRAVVAESEGHRASLGECLSAAGKVILPLIAVGILFGLAMVVGFALLVVPGILVMIIWSVAAPALVVERDGVGRAFGRSAELTAGSRWKIFGLFLVLLVLYILLFAALGVLGLRQSLNASPAEFGVMNVIISGITAMIMNLVWGTIQPSLYVELRKAHEGDSADHLAHVFA